jgi:hypothetical protein
MARVSVHAISIVPDNHNKFAIAVTRARVDSPSFLLLVPPVCELFASVGGQRHPAIFADKGAPMPAN